MPRSESPRGRVPLALALLATLPVLVGFVLLFSGGDEDPPSRSADSQREQGREGPAGPGSETAGQRAPEATPPGEASATPAAAVRSFYEQAAAGDYAGAWQFATPAFREQLGGFDAFSAQQSTLESISFEEISVTGSDGSSATVAVVTIAVHSDRTDRCRGDVELTRGGSAWLLDAIAIDCS